jgi:hypothetical protein
MCQVPCAVLKRVVPEALFLPVGCLRTPGSTVQAACSCSTCPPHGTWHLAHGTIQVAQGLEQGHAIPRGIQAGGLQPLPGPRVDREDHREPLSEAAQRGAELREGGRVVHVVGPVQGDQREPPHFREALEPGRGRAGQGPQADQGVDHHVAHEADLLRRHALAQQVASPSREGVSSRSASWSESVRVGP